MSSDSQMAATYVPPTQYDRWKDRADDLDMSVSEFIKGMVEAGNKKFEATVEPDEEARELREQRNYYKSELERMQSRLSKLEDRLDRGERSEIVDFVEENPGVSVAEIYQQLLETLQERTNETLEELEGDKIELHDDACYLIEDAPEERS